MRKPSPGAVNPLLRGNLNRGEKVAGKRGGLCGSLRHPLRNKRIFVTSGASTASTLVRYKTKVSGQVYIVYHCDGKNIR